MLSVNRRGLATWLEGMRVEDEKVFKQSLLVGGTLSWKGHVSKNWEWDGKACKSTELLQSQNVCIFVVRLKAIEYLRDFLRYLSSYNRPPAFYTGSSICYLVVLVIFSHHPIHLRLGFLADHPSATGSLTIWSICSVWSIWSVWSICHCSTWSICHSLRLDLLNTSGPRRDLPPW